MTFSAGSSESRILMMSKLLKNVLRLSYKVHGWWFCWRRSWPWPRSSRGRGQMIETKAKTEATQPEAKAARGQQNWPRDRGQALRPNIPDYLCFTSLQYITVRHDQMITSATRPGKQIWRSSVQRGVAAHAWTEFVAEFVKFKFETYLYITSGLRKSTNI